MKFLIILTLPIFVLAQVNHANRFSDREYQPPLNYEQKSIPSSDSRFERGAGIKRLQRIRATIQSISQRSRQRHETNVQVEHDQHIEPMHNTSKNPFYHGDYPRDSNNPFANNIGQSIEPRRKVKKPSGATQTNFSEGIDGPRAEPTPEEDQIIKLLTKCEKLGPFMDKNSEQGDKARELYGKHCNVVIEQLALKESLDVFYRIHGTYLAMMGRHQDANTYLTHYYQVAPQDFESNYLMIQNLADLGHNKMAVDMLTFFQERNQHRNFSITQQDKLQKLQRYAQSTQ